MKPFARLALCLAPFLSLACTQESSKAPGAKPRIAVIPKGTTHIFWQTVEKGARVGAAEANVEMLFKGPLQENDRAQQIALVQQFLGAGIDALCLAPLDHTALAPVVAQAKAQKIPVVIFDSALDGVAGADFASFVATNNTAGGKLGGEQLVKLLGGKGKVVLLRYNVGSASTEEREAGFLAAAKAGGLEVTVDNRYAGATLGEAKTSALNLLDALREAQGVFCSNESASSGMLLALEQMDLAGKLKFVGFDASPPLVAGLRAGKIDALVVQDPKRMGQLAVSTAAAALRGERVPPAIDTGAVLVTRENMGDPSVAALLE
ncbi:MAG: sugar ABC transporter substrate-binding protein [Planctomycetes bacterium]|nr:sugar ABC transporter substrate-binding protein [Planctomycetota bacterium]